MRILELMTLFLFTCFTAAAAEGRRESGVEFFKGSWAELLEMAQKQGKLIFVDVYTDWCPPCKRMDKEVFPLPEVGEKYNALFLNYKLDAERGEGIEIAGKYGVKAYPTYLYLDAQGNLLHRTAGFNAPTSIIAHAAKAVSVGSDENSISFMEKEFKSGNRKPDFLRAYIKKKTGLGLDNSEVLNAYLEHTPASRLSTPEELMFMGSYMRGARSNALVFLMEHYGALNEEQKKKLADRLYTEILYDATAAAWKEVKPVEAKQLIAYIDALNGYISEKHHAGINNLRMLYYGMVKDVVRLKEVGYRIVGNLMEIPLDSIRAEDARLYQQFMKPYLSGELDSNKLKTEAFEEEKKFLVKQYSGKISATFYRVASAFSAALDRDDAALTDALAWAERAKSMNPTDPVIKLVAELNDLVGRRPKSASPQGAR